MTLLIQERLSAPFLNFSPQTTQKRTVMSHFLFMDGLCLAFMVFGASKSELGFGHSQLWHLALGRCVLSRPRGCDGARCGGGPDPTWAELGEKHQLFSVMWACEGTPSSSVQSPEPQRQLDLAFLVRFTVLSSCFSSPVFSSQSTCFLVFLLIHSTNTRMPNLCQSQNRGEQR